MRVTTGYSRERLAEIERRRQEEAAQIINDAHKAKRALDWLESTGCVSSPGCFWSGEGSLTDYLLARCDEERWKQEPKP